MSGGYTALYPDAPAKEAVEGFLKGLSPDTRKAVVTAILALEAVPRPISDDDVEYVETNSQKMLLFIRMLPGIPFSESSSKSIKDHLYAKHRITVAGVTVVYAIDESKKLVWLMGIRKAG